MTAARAAAADGGGTVEQQGVTLLALPDAMLSEVMGGLLFGHTAAVAATVCLLQSDEN